MYAVVGKLKLALWAHFNLGHVDFVIVVLFFFFHEVCYKAKKREKIGKETKTEAAVSFVT